MAISYGHISYGTLVITHNDSISGSGGAEAAWPHLSKSPVADDCRIIRYTADEGAGLHCEIGARSLVWERVMDELLPLLRSKLGA